MKIIEWAVSHNNSNSRGGFFFPHLHSAARSKPHSPIEALPLYGCYLWLQRSMKTRGSVRRQIGRRSMDGYITECKEYNSRWWVTPIMDSSTILGRRTARWMDFGGAESRRYCRWFSEFLGQLSESFQAWLLEIFVSSDVAAVALPFS